MPTLIVGHHGEPLHPFSDSGGLAEEMPNAELVEANSLVEWRLRPARLDETLADFLDHVWSESARQRWRRRVDGAAAS